MKINFLIGHPVLKEASSLKEILSEYDLSFYQAVKALELNQDFEKEIYKARKLLGIPQEGLKWEDFGVIKEYKTKEEKKELDYTMQLIDDAPQALSVITDKFNFDSRIEDQLSYILLTNSIFPDFETFKFGLFLKPDDEFKYMDKEQIEAAKRKIKTLNISIFRQVNKNELLNFIKDEWQYIEEKIKKLPKNINYYISKRDRKIIELREVSKLTFKQIANIISKEFELDDVESTINEDSIKTAYRRAKQKILSFSKLKGTRG